MGTFESRGRRLMSLSILIDANDDALTLSDRQLNFKRERCKCRVRVGDGVYNVAVGGT